MTTDATTDAVAAKARELWAELAGVPVSFDPPGGVRVVTSPESLLCPRGWVGVVALGDSAIATAPSDAAAAMVRTALSGLAVDAAVDADAVAALLPLAHVLGPATLAYAGPNDFRPASAEGLVVEQLPVEHPELRALERAAGQEDAGEAAIDEMTSPAFAVRIDGEAVAVSGYRAWPRRTAHISVLTAPAWRGRGLARAAASAAVAHALAEDLLPQWRARPPASRRVAAALGFRELGAQLSFRLAADAPEGGAAAPPVSIR